MTKRVVCYIRVSSQEQAQEGFSISAQKERLIAYCKAKGWIVVDIIIDPGYTGANMNRPGLQQLKNNIKKYDLVLVYKLDRLSRSQRDTLFLIEEVFLPNNVDFVSINESFDTSTPFGRAMIGILSVFAQLERETIKERTKMGMIERAKLGLRNGSGSLPVGYDYSTDTGKLIVNQYEAEQVRIIYDMFLRGKSFTAIAQHMRECGYKHKRGEYRNSSSLKYILSNSVYIGTLTYNDIEVENAHEPIISKNKWERVQKILDNREGLFPDNFSGPKKYLLSGFLICGYCSSRMSINNRGHIKKYSCYSYDDDNSVYRMSGSHCEQGHIRVELLDAMVDWEVRNLVFEQDYFDKLLRKRALKETPKSINIEPKIIQDKIDDIDKQISKLMELYKIDKIPAAMLGAEIDKLHTEKISLQENLKTLPEPVESDLNIDEIRELLKNAADVWDMADLEQKRFLLSALIRKITVYNDRIDIDWAFLPKQKETAEK